MDAPSICFSVMMMVGFVLTFKIIFDTEKIKHQQTENENLQQENTSLIERNEKLDTYLDETRAVVITQNKIISDLHSKYPSPECDESCFYHCTKGGQQPPECVTEE